MAETWTTLKVLQWTEGRFSRAPHIDAPRLEAQVLLAHVLECERIKLYTGFDRPLAPEELAAYRGLIQRRLAGEPVAYLVGEQEFWSLPFTVDARVLIPRRDTETVIEVVLDLVPRDRALRIADLCTGPGTIAITLARELSQATVVASDVSADAVALAQINAERNGTSARVDIRCGDLWGPLAGEDDFDLLVSNPPYVPTDVIDTLSSEVRREPRLALDGGADGLDVVRRIVHQAGAHVRPGGWLVLEHGHDQAPAVAALIADTGAFAAAEVRADLGGNPRVSYACRLGGGDLGGGDGDGDAATPSTP